jgi:hypothetical protein
MAEAARPPTSQELTMPRAPKYEPLENHLRSSGEASVSLTFRHIERILGAPLPRSAREYREWWSNQADTSNRPQAAAWLNAGYRVDEVHQTGTMRVKFVARRNPR